jgi:hypothetical protein
MASNDRGIAAINRMVAKLRSTGSVPAEVARLAAPELEKILLANIAAGRDADGNPWQLNKNGSRPLQTAGRALTVRALHTAVVARLTGHIARHHRGDVKGKIRRPILPAKSLPTAMVDALERVYRDTVSRRFDA